MGEPLRKKNMSGDGGVNRGTPSDALFCVCGKCPPKSGEERVCCGEEECYSKSEEFASVCLNLDVLQVLHVQRELQYPTGKTLRELEPNNYRLVRDDS